MMATRLPKLRQSILVSSVAVLILVSVSSAEKTRCYWCGPLAEQVHRSQRAPSCDTFHLEQHETLCDPGYSHCATVATSPPYAESRLCVKFYQDECYSLYCNSTKTWRMVCACQGNLCNGPHTEREKEAFALVPKFSKNKPRNKRATANFISVKTKSVLDDNTVIIMGQIPNDTQILNDQPDESGEHITSQMTPTPKRAEDSFLIVHGTLITTEKNHDLSKGENHNVSKSDNDTTMSETKDKHVNTNKTMDTYIETTKMDAHNDIKTEKTLDDTKIDKPYFTEVNNDHQNEKIKNLNTTENGNNHTITEIDSREEITTITAEAAKANHDSVVTTMSMKQTTVEISVEVQTSATPGKMPPAENLQQNVTPTKAVEVTTMATVATTDNSHIETTLPSEVNNDIQKKNSATQNLVHIMVFIVCFLAHCCV